MTLPTYSSSVSMSSLRRQPNAAVPALACQADRLPEDFAEQGSLGVQGGEVLNGCQDGGEPLGDELPDAILGGEVSQQMLLHRLSGLPLLCCPAPIACKPLLLLLSTWSRQVCGYA